MVDPDKDPPPLITTLTPSPINPKEIWNQHYNIDTENNLAQLEAAAMEYQIQRESDAAVDKNDELWQGNNSDDESIFGARAADPSAKKKTKGSKAKTKDIQFITSAIANTKAAVRFMTNIKIANKIVTVSERSFSELTYHQIFVQKTLTPADISYFTDRQSTNSILNVIDTEIANAPDYEWYPRTALTTEQIREMELRQVQYVNEATDVHEACRRILSRRKESTEREVISRVINEEREKELAKAVRDNERKRNAQAKGINNVRYSNYITIVYLRAHNISILPADAKRVEREAKKEAKELEKAAAKKELDEKRAAAKQEKAEQKNAAKHNTSSARKASREPQQMAEPKESSDDQVFVLSVRTIFMYNINIDLIY